MKTVKILSSNSLIPMWYTFWLREFSHCGYYYADIYLAEVLPFLCSVIYFWMLSLLTQLFLGILFYLGNCGFWFIWWINLPGYEYIYTMLWVLSLWPQELMPCSVAGKYKLASRKALLHAFTYALVLIASLTACKWLLYGSPQLTCVCVAYIHVQPPKSNSRWQNGEK